MIKIENYFCSIEPCKLLCFKNNIIACEALMQFAEPNNDRMCVTVFLLTFENAIGAKIAKII